ncbi:MAG TPA: RodZ domain-containing protein [Acidimicrobiales bacterium]|jgi:hypothetical protein|nr:RodZ domain-containing protein [Acidimicrobiales bacterium]
MGWIVLGVVVLILAIIVVARVAIVRSERRATEVYGSVSEQARRRDPGGSVRILPPSQVGGGHVRPLAGRPTRAHAANRDAARPTGAFRPAGETAHERRPESGRPGRSETRAAEAPRSFPEKRTPYASTAVPDDGSYGDRGRAPRDPSGSASVGHRRLDLEPPTETVSDEELRRQANVRRMTVGAVAAVALTFIVVASILLAGGPSPHSSSPPTTTRPRSGASTTTTTTSATTTTKAPTTLQPVTGSNGLVSYVVPKGPFTIGFADTGTGPSWLGVESSFGSGDFLWQNEVQPQQSLSYDAKGPVAVNIGAPAELKITVDGVPCTLPQTIPSSTIAFINSSG